MIPSQVHIYGGLHPPSQMNMGIAYLAAAIEDMAEVTVIDIDGQKVSVDKYKENISKNVYDIVAFTVTTPTFYNSVELAKITKEILPNSLIIFGGYHPTLKPLEVISLPEVDITVVGQGEETLIDIVRVYIQNDKIRRQSLDNLREIPGILFKNNGTVIQNPLRLSEPIDYLDKLKFPARHLFKNIEYSYPDALYPKVGTMITSRGCPGRCTYCNAHNMYNRKIRFRSAKNVVDEIEQLIAEGYQEIAIWDDNFVTNRKRVFQIRDEIKSRGISIPISFPGGVRADYLDSEVIHALKEMGTYSLAIGVESGNQIILDNVKKGIKLEQIEEAFKLTKVEKLETWAFFMLGLPGETPETIQKTISFAKKLDPDVAKFHILKPYPGSEVYDWLRDRGLLLSENYNAYGIHCPPVHYLEGLSPEDLVNWQSKAYKEFFLTPMGIIKQIRRIKSFHRLKVNFLAGLDVLKLINKQVGSKHE